MMLEWSDSFYSQENAYMILRAPTHHFASLGTHTLKIIDRRIKDYCFYNSKLAVTNYNCKLSAIMVNRMPKKQLKIILLFGSTIRETYIVCYAPIAMRINE